MGTFSAHRLRDSELGGADVLVLEMVAVSRQERAEAKHPREMETVSHELFERENK